MDVPMSGWVGGRWWKEPLRRGRVHRAEQELDEPMPRGGGSSRAPRCVCAQLWSAVDAFLVPLRVRGQEGRAVSCAAGKAESTGSAAAVPRRPPLRRGERWCVRRGAGRGGARRGGAQGPQCRRLPPPAAASSSPWRCAAAPRSSCRPHDPRPAAPGPPRPSSGNGRRKRRGGGCRGRALRVRGGTLRS